MKTKFKLLLLICVIVFACLILYFSFWFSGKTASQHTVQKQKINVYVKLINPVSMPITLTSIGSLYAKRAVEINPQIAGQIASISFKYGQTVKKGQLLYQLDDQFYQAQYQAAKSDLHLSEITYRRTQKLVRHDAISRQALDTAHSAYQDALAKLQVNKILLEKTQIRAPFSGIIGASNVDAGQYVKVGQSLAQLVDKADLIVKFSLPEQYLNQLAVEQAVAVSSSAFPQKNFNGKVNFISPAVDPSTRTVMIWAKVPNPNLLLSPGLFVHVILQIGVKHNVIAIPQQALIPTVEGNDVFIVKKGQAYQKAVTIGRRIGDEVMISKGLHVGDSVVTLGQEKLANGREVKVISK